MCTKSLVDSNFELIVQTCDDFRSTDLFRLIWFFNINAKTFIVFTFTTFIRKINLVLIIFGSRFNLSFII